MILHADAIFDDYQAEFTHDGFAGCRFHTAIGRHPGDDEARQPPGAEELIEPGAGERPETMLGDNSFSRLRAKSLDEFRAPRARAADFCFIFVEPAVGGHIGCRCGPYRGLSPALHGKAIWRARRAPGLSVFRPHVNDENAIFPCGPQQFKRTANSGVDHSHRRARAPCCAIGGTKIVLKIDEKQGCVFGR